MRRKNFIEFVRIIEEKKEALETVIECLSSDGENLYDVLLELLEILKFCNDYKDAINSEEVTRIRTSYIHLPFIRSMNFYLNNIFTEGDTP